MVRKQSDVNRRSPLKFLQINEQDFLFIIVPVPCVAERGDPIAKLVIQILSHFNNEVTKDLRH